MTNPQNTWAELKLMSGVTPPDEDVFPCSLTQQRFWFLTQLEPDNSALNVALRWRFDGPMSSDILETALNALIARHEILRTQFIAVDGLPFQKVLPKLTIKVANVDLSRRPERDALKEAENISANEAQALFDLDKGPLVRATLLRLGSEKSILLLTFHHLIVDGWAVDVLMGELLELMAAAASGRPANLPEVEIQYVDYALWKVEALQKTDFSAIIDFWRKELSGLPRFELPADKPRPANFTHASALRSLALPPALSASLESQAGAMGGTLFMVFGAALAAALRQRTGADEVVLGTQAAGRDSGERLGIIGPLINTVVLRLRVDRQMTFAALTDRFRTVVMRALDNWRLPFEALVGLLNAPRDPSRTPLFSINFSMDSGQHSAGTVEVQRSRPTRYAQMLSLPSGALYDLNFFVSNGDGGWRLSCEANTDLFESETVDDLLNAWLAALHTAADSGGKARVDDFKPPEAVKRTPQATQAPEAAAKAPAHSAHADAVAIPLVRDIWRELLERDDVTPETHFFEAGGHSLLALRMIARVRKAIASPIGVADLFRHPKLGDFVAAITGDAPLDKGHVVAIQPHGARPPIFVINNAWDLFPLSQNLPKDQPLLSVQFVDRNIEAPKEKQPMLSIADEAVAQIRQGRPHGPYVLMGHCILGAVALEAARRLKSEGEDVKLVVLMDTDPNLRSTGISLTRRVLNRLVMEVRRARWNADALMSRRVSLLHVLKRSRSAERLGLVWLAMRFGLRDRWNLDDFHTQHVVDAWQDQVAAPYDGDVVHYIPQPGDKPGLLDRWFPSKPVWQSIIRGRLTVERVNVRHSEMFRHAGAAQIGGHLTKLLSEDVNNPGGADASGS